MLNNETDNALPNSLQGDERTKRLMAMGQMAASLAHEIRNPLGSMELYCSLLKKDLSNQPEALGLAQHIHDGIRTLDRIISNCLQFARDLNPKKRVVSDIEKFVVDSARCVQNRLVGAEIKISFTTRGEGEVSFDQSLLQQVLSNLIANAIDAIEQKRKEIGRRVEGVIEIESDFQEANLWTLSVNDNGVGIPEEHREQLFDPFFSTKREGIGLGLPIIHSIVHAHGGALEVSSELGRGTRMSVVLPR